MKPWYYYLHTNGDLIGKNPAVVDSDPAYFDSPFVKRTWLIDADSKETAWVFLLEALALGARVERARELAEHWKMDYNDSIEMLSRVDPNELMKKGMTIMIQEVFMMDVEDYWDSIRSLDEKGGKNAPN